MRLRDLLLLAARVAALLLLAGSFARPYLSGAAPSGRTTVVAVDRSFSMAAPARFERARALAGDALNSAQAAGDRIALVAFAWQPAMERAGFVRDAAYLVRPDGYVGLGDDKALAATLEAYLDDRGLMRGGAMPAADRARRAGHRRPD